MVEPVVTLLNGYGHPITRARDAGIEAEDDQVVVEYALSKSLVVVTFDRGLRDKVSRGGGRCLYVRAPERTARRRLAKAYVDVIRLFVEEHRDVVTLAGDGKAV